MHGATIDPHDGGTPRRNSPRGISSRVMFAALLISAVIHSVVLLSVRFAVDATQLSRVSRAPQVVQISDAIEVYELIEVAAAEVAPIDVQVAEREELRIREAPPLLPAAATVAPAAEPQRQAVRPSARDQLHYRMGAPEVWTPPPAVPLDELLPEEVVAARLAARTGEFNDSVALEAAARGRATDWTVKDADGARWGVSPGKIHVGDVTLPMPFVFAPPPGRRDEVADRVRVWTETQAQAARVEGNEIIRDRVKAIRARADQERARRRAAADTTRTGGGV